jgi:hypothetical protein
MKMKNMFSLSLILLVGASIFVSCSKSDQTANQSVEGTYNGSFSTSNTLKGAQLALTGDVKGTAVVNMINSRQIKVHCFGTALDSTFILDIYNYGDSMKVCMTGNAFAKEYGHMMGQGSVMGGTSMMGNNATAWAQHMNQEHKAGDEHFGGFNMVNHIFDYTFKQKAGSSSAFLKFHGNKQ